MSNEASILILSLELIDQLDKLEGSNLYKGKLKTRAMQLNQALESHVLKIDGNIRAYETAEKALRRLRKRMSIFVDKELFR